MRKIILFIADSLDGYIARKDDTIDWLFTEGDYGYNEFISNVDTMIMGRKTFDIAIKLGDTSYMQKKWCVFSKSHQVKENDYVKFINSDIVKFTQEILKQEGQNIWLVGGGEIIKIFLENNLIDEIILAVHPVILGDGIPLFPPSNKQSNLVFKDCRTYENGLVQLFYDVKK